MRNINTTTKTSTAFAAVVLALLVTTGPASAKTITAGGGGGQVSQISPDPGLVNKLNAMLDELPSAGVGRPGSGR
jgi:hypothetical protein